MTIIMSMMASINILMIFMKHPMSMGMLLMTQTIMTAMLSGMSMNMFWTSYVILISMLSGMLVLFIYMSSIASNEKFMSKTPLWVAVMIIMSMGVVLLFLQEKMIIKNNLGGMEMSLFPLNKMFMMEGMSITIMLVMYLFVSMIASSHLVNIFEGPMRSKNKYE